MRYITYTLLAAATVVLLMAPVLVGDARPVRVVGDVRYEILEAGPLYIYTTNVVVRKGAAEKAYFFSVGSSGPVLPLTILNLKNAFPNNHAFHDNLDMMFKNDSDLRKFDTFHKTFKVNHLLEASER